MQSPKRPAFSLGKAVRIAISRKERRSWRRTVVAQFGSGRLCAQGKSLVPLVKTRDFGMTPGKR
jgi:hypothetical protein